MFFFSRVCEIGVRFICTHKGKEKLTHKQTKKKCSPAGRLKKQMFVCQPILCKPGDNILNGKT